ncbi:MAG: hypothetical protein FWH38_09865 [Treponema sp.]|nr:hypothetical protein [Treponema sp.]
MKRTVLFFTLAFCVLALASAQGNDRWGRRRNQGEPPRNSREQGSPRDFGRKAESASVSGDLTLVRGMAAVDSGGVTYIAGGLMRFAGFIDGLKEGAAVTLEGMALPLRKIDNVKVLFVQKMTLNGKDYDLGRSVMPNSMPPTKHPPMHRKTHRR